MTTLTLTHWQHPRLPSDHPLSDRWSLEHEGKAILTFSTELEARRAARGHGWEVDTSDGLERVS